ncbi:MAG: membrane integrity-associated transporter subunit PqiC [Desulfofustis sp. PB-SRB1]|nr:membrane integrity-associated transporter subunit PqiC [Desulfofustis sp. PB-SRB1]MBM1001589.1 membrane integrity-associated transporter subunit PqiC [Desulfofustis sp. PB-SRB1]HBH29812.1 hypothetical protein [Desulfofustis sp.]HBH31591.1 hypothetical protein [Desulfofustis sp.]
MQRTPINRPSAGLMLLGLMMLVAAAGCSVVDLPGEPPELYNLTPKTTFSKTLPTVDTQLIIEEPIAAGGLDTNRIALRPHATRLQFLADSRWTERAPKMMQTLLVESFENTGKIVAVGRQSIGLRSDYILKTELREFQVETDKATGAFAVRVRINGKIVAQPNRAIIGSQSFEHVAAVAENGGIQAIIIAYDIAAGKVLKNIVEWTLHTIE